MNSPQPSPDRRYVSPRDVAEALDVSETTVKRWVDEGRLPARRTEGGHRRILVADVLQYAGQRNWPHVNLGRLLGSEVAPPSIDLVELTRQLQSAVFASDSEQARALVMNAHYGGVSIARLGDDVIAPVMARVGHAWASGEVDVYEEHRATQICLSAVLALKAHLDSTGEESADRPLAVGGGPEKDHYLLANLLIELSLRESGWRVMNIGPNTPFPSFCRAIEEQRPRLLWLSCSHIDDVEAFLAGYASMYTEAVRHGVVVTVGGRALNDEIRQRLQYTHHGDRLSHLLEFARHIWSAPRR